MFKKEWWIFLFDWRNFDIIIFVTSWKCSITAIYLRLYLYIMMMWWDSKRKRKKCFSNETFVISLLFSRQIESLSQPMTRTARCRMVRNLARKQVSIYCRTLDGDDTVMSTLGGVFLLFILESVMDIISSKYFVFFHILLKNIISTSSLQILDSQVSSHFGFFFRSLF